MGELDGPRFQNMKRQRSRTILGMYISVVMIVEFHTESVKDWEFSKPIFVAEKCF